MMTRYFLLDECGDFFMVLRLTEMQVKAIQALKDKCHMRDITFEPLDETKHVEYLTKWFKSYCLSCYEKFEIPEHDTEIIFYISDDWGDTVFKGTLSQYNIIKYLYKKHFNSERGWGIGKYSPPTIEDIR